MAVTAIAAPASGAQPLSVHRVRLRYGGVKLCHEGQAVVLVEAREGLHAFVCLGAGEQLLGLVRGASLAMSNEVLWRAVMRNGGVL